MGKDRSIFQAELDRIGALGMVEFRFLDDKYRIETDALQKQLGIELKTCKTPEEAQKKAEEYFRKTKELTAKHSENVEKVTSKYQEKMTEFLKASLGRVK